MYERIRRRLALGLAVAALVGCARDPARPNGANDAPEIQNPPIRTDREEYVVRYEGDANQRIARLSIGLTYTNRTASETYLPSCRGVNPPILEKWEGGRWVTAYAAPVLACLGPPDVVQPGATYQYTFEVYAYPRDGNAYPQFEVAEIPGTYRLVWGIYETWTPHGGTPGLGRVAPLEGRVSNTFRIVR